MMAATLEQARRAVQEGRLDAAAGAYRALRSQAPGEAAQFLGVLALRTGRPAEAVGELQAASRALPDDLGTLENLEPAPDRCREGGAAVVAALRKLGEDLQPYKPEVL